MDAVSLQSKEKMSRKAPSPYLVKREAYLVLGTGLSELENRTWIPACAGMTNINNPRLSALISG
jgi:hypothetical protein